MGSHVQCSSVRLQFIQVADKFNKHFVPYMHYCLPSPSKQARQAAWLRNMPQKYQETIDTENHIIDWEEATIIGRDSDQYGGSGRPRLGPPSILLSHIYAN